MWNIRSFFFPLDGYPQVMIIKEVWGYGGICWDEKPLVQTLESGVTGGSTNNN
jgi:hypothetical protein